MAKFQEAVSIVAGFNIHLERSIDDPITKQLTDLGLLRDYWLSVRPTTATHNADGTNDEVIDDVWPLCMNRRSVITAIPDRLIAFREVTRRPGDRQIRGLIATVWKPSVSLAVLNASTLQHIGALTLRPTRWLVHLLMSKLLKLLCMFSSRSIVTFVRQAYCVLVQHSLI